MPITAAVSAAPVIHAAASSPVLLPAGVTTILIQNVPADPHWTAYVQALGTPIVAVIAAGFATYIAWRQWKTAHEKLKFDLFKERVAIHQAMTRFVDASFEERMTREEDEAWEYAKEKAIWLFDQPVMDYLNNLSKANTALWTSRHAVKKEQNPELKTARQDQLELVVSAYRDLWQQNWLVFAPYLRFGR